MIDDYDNSTTEHEHVRLWQIVENESSSERLVDETSLRNQTACFINCVQVSS